MNTVSIAEYKGRKDLEEWNRRMYYALRPRDQDQEYLEWSDKQRAETKREEKLQKRREKILEKLEETKKHLWNISDDHDFEKKSQALIHETIA